MNSSLVSIIVPCKNAAPWLFDAIHSCLVQTHSDIEVVVVDNGSTDDSVAIAEAVADPRLVVLHCGRKGASAARNTGLDRARGEYIQFLDADDLLHADKIRVQLARLAEMPEGTIASGAWAVFRDDPASAVFTPQPVWRDFSPGEFMICSWLGGGMMPPIGWLTPRAVIEKAGRWNEGLSLDDDGEYFARVNLASSGVGFCRGALCFYRKYDRQSLSSRKDAEALASGFEAVRLSSEALMAAVHTSDAKRACAANFQRFIYYAYPWVPHLTRVAEEHVLKLGGSDLKLEGGLAFRILAACFGWKFARRCQLAWGRAIRSPRNL